jgi:hypothetical protein
MSKLLFLSFGVWLAASASGAAAQTLYRCGNTFSQTPCGDGAREVRAAGVAQPVVAPPLGPIDGVRETDLAARCVHAIRSIPSWKDRESLKVSRPERAAAGVARDVNGRRIAVVPWYAQVNAKNSYGGYTGDKMANCYFDSTESRIVDLYIEK